MDKSAKNNNKYLFYDDLDDNINGYTEGNYYFNNMSYPFTPNGKNSFYDDTFIDNSKKYFKMKLRSTVADSKFREQSAYNVNSKPKREKTSEESSKTEDMFDFSYNDAKNAETQFKDFYERTFTKKTDYDKASEFSGIDMFDQDVSKEDSENYDINYFVNQSKTNGNIFGDGKGGGQEDGKFDLLDLVSTLRDIANKIEFNDYKNTSKTMKYEDHILFLNNKISRLNEELKVSRKELDATKSKMEEKIGELESHIRQLTSMVRESGSDTFDLGFTENVVGKSSEVSSTTIPAVTVEFSELDQESKAFANRLMRYLYADINDSESSQFMPRLYKCLKQMPEVVQCKQVVKHIEDCIRRDAQKIHARLSQNGLLAEEELFVDSVFGIPQSNAERQVVSELESTLQFTSNSKGAHSESSLLSPKAGKSSGEEVPYTKTHVIMNRGVAWAIFKATSMNSLYNYLFEALDCDNFRIVETINYAICSKFMDFQLAQKYEGKVRHPLMWSFGQNCNSSQAYRYVKMLNYNFHKLPSDPTTGDNLWHMVARGNSTYLAQRLKSFSIYTQNLNEVNKAGRTPLDISTNVVRRELYVNLIVDLASKGSEMYKRTDYDKALEFYNDAINYQSQLITSRCFNDNGSATRDSATYTDNTSSGTDRQSGRDSHSGGYTSTTGGTGSNANGGGPTATTPGLSGRPESRSARDAPVRSDNYDLNMGKLYYNKARTLMHLNRWVESIEYCEMCLKHIPNYYNAYETCVRAYENLLDWDSAAKTCVAMRENCGLMDEHRYQYILDQRDATYFQLLDVDKNASQADIKKAFNAMCKIWHPDKNTHNLSEDIKKRCINHFNRLFEAREKLMDPSIKSLQQMKRETNYKVPSPCVNSERTREDAKEPQKESSVEFYAEETKESNRFEPQNDATSLGEKKAQKSSDPKLLKSRDTLNELTMERLKFMDSFNLLKGQASFDYESFSWGQLFAFGELT
ncbi:uncharacterized protein TOT_020000407 [Theileria orientalis strain Shintoku]|uniref:J domain-containing protein n=1 Tax=Theileria orientalis strain Shintoku TaxID=869250 RepID=J4DP60_THEOR|nr:uncharacterized protein TOT_020000407 [Theileria orientalis strain Shintoku]BAM40144.1 uncharacterized protein TOT_020000407 [Theileria orientalis strain Shintoku]|eukprot:XP_009690445.1 uncharacterized protein TOT_020000407 [Theileria orientalis strain Shintoku]